MILAQDFFLIVEKKPSKFFWTIGADFSVSQKSSIRTKFFVSSSFEISQNLMAKLEIKLTRANVYLAHLKFVLKFSFVGITLSFAQLPTRNLVSSSVGVIVSSKEDFCNFEIASIPSLEEYKF